MISGMILPKGIAATQAIARLVQPGFKFDITGRIKVLADTDQFRFGEDPFVYDQAVGKIKNFFEVYWDGVWMCDINEGMDDNAVCRAFWKGFYEAYSAKRVFLNTPEERLQWQIDHMPKQETVEQKIDKLKVDADPKLVHMGKEVLKKVAKEKIKKKGK